MVEELYEKYKMLNIDLSPLGLENNVDIRYFCTPVGSKIIGTESEGIHYCFIQGLGEMVFAVNPCSCCEYYVYPIAKDFADFLGLLLSAKSITALEQIIIWQKQDYVDFINSPDEIDYRTRTEVSSVLLKIKEELEIAEIEQPFEYVKELQENFDYSKIPFSDEYYSCTGREKE